MPIHGKASNAEASSRRSVNHLTLPPCAQPFGLRRKRILGIVMSLRRVAEVCHPCPFRSGILSQATGFQLLTEGPVNAWPLRKFLRNDSWPMTARVGVARRVCVAAAAPPARTNPVYRPQCAGWLAAGAVQLRQYPVLPAGSLRATARSGPGFASMNVGVVAPGALVGLLLFRERLSRLNLAGVVLAVGVMTVG